MILFLFLPVKNLLRNVHQSPLVLGVPDILDGVDGLLKHVDETTFSYADIDFTKVESKFKLVYFPDCVYARVPSSSLDRRI